MAPHGWTPAEWNALLLPVIGALFAGLASLIVAWRTKVAVQNHDATSRARARELGQPVNPRVTQEDRGKV